MSKRVKDKQNVVTRGDVKGVKYVSLRGGISYIDDINVREGLAHTTPEGR